MDKSKFYANRNKKVSKYVSLAEAAEEAECCSNETDIVIIPPDNSGGLSDEEDLPDDRPGPSKGFPTDVAGTLEVHKIYNSSDEETEESEDESELSFDDQSETSDEEYQDPEPVHNKRKRYAASDSHLTITKPAAPSKRRKTVVTKKTKTTVNTSWKKKEDTKLSAPVYVWPDTDVPHLIETNPELSALDPFEIWAKYITPAMVQEILYQTIMYARNKNNQKFMIGESELCNFLGLLYVSGYHTLPGERDCWSTKASMKAPIYSETMSRERFKEIKRYVHLADNNQLGESKTAKVDPLHDSLLQNLQQFGVFHEKLSIDESMVPYYGKFPIKQFIRGKPVRFGYKFWFLCSSDGYPYNFELYKGRVGDRKTQLGREVVTNMAKVIKEPANHILHHDNFFTSKDLLEELAAKGQRAVGTMRTNRTGKCPLNIVKKDVRGKFDYRSNGNVLVTQWRDNAIVTVGTNYSNVHPVKKVQRWVKGQGRTQVEMPLLIDDYNKGMGGVDTMDQLLGSYRPTLRSKKWWWPLLNNVLNVAMVAAYKTYTYTSRAKVQLSHLEFVTEVAEVLVRADHRARMRLGGPTAQTPAQVRKDGINHHITSAKSQGRCAYCQKNTRTQCTKCDKRLHRECSKHYHM